MLSLYLHQRALQKCVQQAHSAVVAVRLVSQRVKYATVVPSALTEKTKETVVRDCAVKTVELHKTVFFHLLNIVLPLFLQT